MRGKRDFGFDVWNFEILFKLLHTLLILPRIFAEEASVGKSVFIGRPDVVRIVDIVKFFSLYLSLCFEREKPPKGNQSLERFQNFSETVFS